MLSRAALDMPYAMVGSRFGRLEDVEEMLMMRPPGRMWGRAARISWMDPQPLPRIILSKPSYVISSKRSWYRMSEMAALLTTMSRREIFGFERTALTRSLPKLGDRRSALMATQVVLGLIALILARVLCAAWWLPT